MLVSQIITAYHINIEYFSVKRLLFMISKFCSLKLLRIYLSLKWVMTQRFLIIRWWGAVLKVNIGLGDISKTVEGFVLNSWPLKHAKIYIRNYLREAANRTAKRFNYNQFVIIHRFTNKCKVVCVCWCNCFVWSWTRSWWPLLHQTSDANKLLSDTYSAYSANTKVFLLYLGPSTFLAAFPRFTFRPILQVLAA